MSPSRRDFMKDAAVVSAAAATTGVSAETASAETPAETTAEAGEQRCPYFDQPMYCKGLSKSGRPLCEE